MMAILPYDKVSEEDYANRLVGVTADSERKFGTMDSTKMLRHMRMSYETACGETDLEDATIPGGKLVYFIIANVMKTWPGGKINAPDFWSPAADGEFDEELRLLKEAQARFLAKLASSPNEVNKHPMMGGLSMKQWSRLLGPHMNHHLRQFGV